MSGRIRVIARLDAMPLSRLDGDGIPFFGTNFIAGTDTR